MIQNLSMFQWSVIIRSNHIFHRNPVSLCVGFSISLRIQCLKLKLPCTLPQEFSNGNTDFYLTGKDEEINLIIKTTDGKLKQYYADYKDYYYLPEEDTVIPKSLGSGIDRKHRKAATRNTCYTWFTCSDAFLSSPVQQKQYLTYTLSCLIETLERV